MPIKLKGLVAAAAVALSLAAVPQPASAGLWGQFTGAVKQMGNNAKANIGAVVNDYKKSGLAQAAYNFGNNMQGFYKDMGAKAGNMMKSDNWLVKAGGLAVKVFSKAGDLTGAAIKAVAGLFVKKTDKESTKCPSPPCEAPPPCRRPPCGGVISDPPIQPPPVDGPVQSDGSNRNDGSGNGGGGGGDSGGIPPLSIPSGGMGSLPPVAVGDAEKRSVKDDETLGAGQPTNFFGMPAPVPAQKAQEPAAFHPRSQQRGGLRDLKDIPGVDGERRCRFSDARCNDGAPAGGKGKYALGWIRGVGSPKGADGGSASLSLGGGAGGGGVGDLAAFMNPGGAGGAGMPGGDGPAPDSYDPGEAGYDDGGLDSLTGPPPESMIGAAGEPIIGANGMFPAEGGMGSGQVPLFGKGGSPQDRAQMLINQAYAKMDLRDWAAAINLLTKAIQLDPGNPMAWTARSMAYNMSGDYASAEADARKAIGLSPGNPKAWENLAWAQMRQGNLQDALKSADEAVRLNPASALAYAIRAYTREQLGDAKGALEDIATAASLDSRYREQYERGLKGGKIYDPNLDYAPFFLRAGLPPVAPAAPAGALALLLLLAAAGAGTWLYCRKKKIPLSSLVEKAWGRLRLAFAGPGQSPRIHLRR